MGKTNTEKEKRAIQYLKSFEPESEPYYLCYSGGKDSDVIRILAKLADVKHEVHNNHTTVDAPETVYYIREVEKEYKPDEFYIHMPERTMWQLISANKVPPTRLYRYCCAGLKEKGGKGRVKVTGVRKAESVARKANGGLVKIIGKPKTNKKLLSEIGADFQESDKGGLILNTDNSENRRAVEMCYRTSNTLVNPIIDWNDADVWEFLKAYGCDSNPLYQCGYKRIGCIGCPMSGSKGMIRDFKKYPTYYRAYRRAFEQMLKNYNKPITWKNGQDVMDWWLGIDRKQITLADYYTDIEFNDLTAMP